MSLRLRQLVLDFDGVIADGTNRAYVDAYSEAIRAVGGEMPQAEIEAGIARHWGESPRRELSGVLGETHPGLDAALAHYLQRIDARLLASARPLPGASQAVARLARRYSLYLVSGMGAVVLEQLLQAFALRRFFQAVVSTCDSEQSARQKAGGYHLRDLCRRSGLRAQETLCVGDAGSDVAMARSCGIRVALVLSGALDRAGAEALEVEWIVDSLAALPDFLERQDWPPVSSAASE
jgi:phosphoglycolate phosphatase-like HAD superfamily hydrolase